MPESVLLKPQVDESLVFENGRYGCEVLIQRRNSAFFWNKSGLKARWRPFLSQTIAFTLGFACMRSPFACYHIDSNNRWPRWWCGDARMRGFPARLGESGCKSPAVPVTVIPLGPGCSRRRSDGAPGSVRLSRIASHLVRDRGTCRRYALGSGGKGDPDGGTRAQCAR